MPDPASLDLDGIWEREWRQNLADVAMHRIKQKVNPKHYHVFDLHVLKDWPAKKVKDTLGISHAQIYLAKHRIEKLITVEIKRLEKEPI